MMRPVARRVLLVVLQGVEPGKWMAYVALIAGRVPLDRGTSFSRTIASVIAAFALASGALAWIDDFDPVARVSDSAVPKDIGTSSFDDRFSVASAPDLSSTGISPGFLVRSLPSELETKFQQAKDRLARKLQSQDWRVTLFEEASTEEASTEEPATREPTVEEPTPSSVAAVPLPRSRPAEANRELQAGPAAAEPSTAAQSDDRTLLQKLSDLLPARLTLASLAPDGGLLGARPNLTSLGYDNLTAVYDISAHAVYMPDGSKLEAHSGLGSLMDDPGHANERNVGATPPNVYDLKPRERLFHGVQALRMIPVGDNGTLGRSGLLAHSYMLGPKGDSNGCVSIKNYEQFLKAFSNGEIKHLVVVPSLGDEMSPSRRSTSQS
jgi:Tlde1 domain